jgi:hypothetical protein
MDWHRLFGLMLTDFFTDSPYVVELEKDLSLKQQYLDVVIVRKQPGEFAHRLPDGLTDLVEHNLISFKSHQEAFDAWAMKELIGHYVNYRKQASVQGDMLPEKSFRLYGVCARFPAQLASQMNLRQLQAGVHECRWGADDVRLIVLRDLPRAEHNAPLHLFSAVRDQVEYAQGHYRRRSAETSSLIQHLLIRYQHEGLVMPYTMEDFRREVRKEVVESLTADELKQLLQKLPAKERLEGLSKAEIEKYLKTLDESCPGAQTG